MTLGQKVRQARIRAGLTQEQAAGGPHHAQYALADRKRPLRAEHEDAGISGGGARRDGGMASGGRCVRRGGGTAAAGTGDAARGGSSGLRGAAGAGSGAGVGRGTLLLAVSAMELAEQALGAEQYDEAARRAEQALRWNARGLYAQQALSLRALAVLARCARGSENVEARIAEYREEYLRAPEAVRYHLLLARYQLEQEHIQAAEREIWSIAEPARSGTRRNILCCAGGSRRKRSSLKTHVSICSRQRRLRRCRRSCCVSCTARWSFAARRSRIIRARISMRRSSLRWQKDEVSSARGSTHEVTL